MPDWWMRLMFWLDTVTIPLWPVLLFLAVVIAAQLFHAWRALDAWRHDPPPPD